MCQKIGLSMLAYEGKKVLHPVWSLGPMLSSIGFFHISHEEYIQKKRKKWKFKPIVSRNTTFEGN